MIYLARTVPEDEGDSSRKSVDFMINCGHKYGDPSYISRLAPVWFGENLDYRPWSVCARGRPHQGSCGSDILILPRPSGRYTFDNVARWIPSLLLSNNCDPDASPLAGLNFIVEDDELNVSLSHAFPATTRRISICGDMHYDMSRSA